MDTPRAGFEPTSQARQACMIGRYTIGAYYTFFIIVLFYINIFYFILNYYLLFALYILYKNHIKKKVSKIPDTILNNSLSNNEWNFIEYISNIISIVIMLISKSINFDFKKLLYLLFSSYNL